MRKEELEQQWQERKRIDRHQRRHREAQARSCRRVALQQGVLGRDPYASEILDGKDQHAEAIKHLQRRAVTGRDIGHGVSHGGCDVGHNEHDEKPIDSARSRFPAAPVLEDLEDPGARAILPLSLCCHCVDPAR